MGVLWASADVSVKMPLSTNLPTLMLKELNVYTEDQPSRSGSRRARSPFHIIAPLNSDYDRLPSFFDSSGFWIETLHLCSQVHLLSTPLGHLCRSPKGTPSSKKSSREKRGHWPGHPEDRASSASPVFLHRSRATHLKLPRFTCLCCLPYILYVQSPGLSGTVECGAVCLLSICETGSPMSLLGPSSPSFLLKVSFSFQGPIDQQACTDLFPLLAAFFKGEKKIRYQRPR